MVFSVTPSISRSLRSVVEAKLQPMVVDRVHPKKYPNSSVFRDVSWDFYKAMLREIDEQPSRINYDRGTLEIMTLSVEHESFKSMLGLMIGYLALTLKVKIKNAGSSTLKRMAKRRGLEADQCYWVAHESQMRRKRRLDLRSDPPPDLVVEIDVMHSVVNREQIYASLGVPEMWVLRRRGDAPEIQGFGLDQGVWQPIEYSKSFPVLRVADLNPFVARIGVDDDNSILNDFFAWVKSLAATAMP